MVEYFKKSLRNKLFLIFTIIGLLPFITLLIYMIFLSETKIVKKIVLEQSQKAQSVVKLINNHVEQLEKETNFLSSLDLMDDLLADDIDKRISRILAKKKSDINLDLDFVVVNKKGLVIASSSKKNLQMKYADTQILKGSNGSYINHKTLYSYSKIHASFERTKELGFLLLEYNLDNLDLYLTHQNTTHSYIINRKNGLKIGEEPSFDLNFTQENNTLINSEHVVVYKEIGSVMKDWFVVYGVDKSVALAFVYDFIRFMLYVALAIFILIIFIAIYYSRGIVKPIEKLTLLTNKITKTQDYETKIYIDSKDEIATLSHSFNEMLNITSGALKKLEKENQQRLKRFTQLIEVFNTIILTKNKQECIDISIKEISKLTNRDDLYFIANKDKSLKKEFSNLYVSDFENDKKIYFGSISLGIEKFEDINEKNFYDSIASMISLQLDRIRLIKSTLSASNAKSAFISNMSHELRTPLNSIMGSAQFLITYEKLNDEQLDTVANIESSAHYLLGMINDILDIAKIEAGKMEAHFESVNLQEIVQNSYNMLLPLAQDKGLTMEFNSNLDNPIYNTDAKMFQQIVLNLLSNAIKFTNDGNVILNLYNDKEKIYISVKDSGIGISKENINSLFQEFSQIKNVMHKTQKGTGLGLVLSQKMAGILGGEILLLSRGLGYGSEAVFRLNKPN